MVKSLAAASVQRDRDTEQRILDAANTVFVRRGTAGARMQEVAEEAGVNKALVHYYFRNKSRLAEAVFRRVASGLFASAGAILGSDVDLETKVQRIIALYLDQLARTPYAPGYVIGELNQHPDRAKQLLDVVRRLRDDAMTPDFVATLATQLRSEARKHNIRAIPAEQFIVNLVSLCIFPFAAKPMLCTVLQLDDKGFARFVDDRKRTLPAFFLNALRP
ncbi:MAG TPA: helix-turn-helix domain-containing protein [Gemmatimonadaceae bacterium]|jgi:TetR/AcrR family transcriptional regulator|nr:helix-turn-helix domain-containing protein [Gemmatimonadaceae bacterium]